MKFLFGRRCAIISYYNDTEASPATPNYPFRRIIISNNIIKSAEVIFCEDYNLRAEVDNRLVCGFGLGTMWCHVLILPIDFCLPYVCIH